VCISKIESVHLFQCECVFLHIDQVLKQDKDTTNKASSEAGNSTGSRGASSFKTPSDGLKEGDKIATDKETPDVGKKAPGKQPPLKKNSQDDSVPSLSLGLNLTGSQEVENEVVTTGSREDPERGVLLKEPITYQQFSAVYKEEISKVHINHLGAYVGGGESSARNVPTLLAGRSKK
jgi:hypothetical protein